MGLVVSYVSVKDRRVRLFCLFLPFCMKSQLPECYILDTCKLVREGIYLPGAVLFRGRKKIDAMSWKAKSFRTQAEADAFVRRHFAKVGMKEAQHEEEIARMNPRW